MKTKPQILYFLLMISFILNLLFGLYLGIPMLKTLKSFPKDYLDTKAHENVISNLTFYDGQELNIIGKIHNEQNYTRLPAKYKKDLRPKVWNLEKHSAGLSLNFSTNSPTIGVRWKLADTENVEFLSNIGQHGVDLYCLLDGKWQYVSTGIPNGRVNESLLIANMDTTCKEFLVNLPLYNSVEDSSRNRKEQCHRCQFPQSI